MLALAVKEKLASGQKTSVDAIRINAVASLVADLHQEKTAANDDVASAALDVWSWEGSAFGSTPPTGSVTINLRRPGEYWDQESSLIYNHHRYLDPAVDRYITSDPIGLKGGLNTYAHVDNNPLRFVDPEGLIKWDAQVWQFGITAPVGGGFMVINARTACIKGKRGVVKAVGVGPGAGVGVRLPKLPKDMPSGTVGNLVFDDFRLDDVIDPGVFNGRFGVSGGSVVVGGGLGHSKIQCGHAFATDTGLNLGYDVGVSGFGGSCTVLESRIEDCCEK